MSFVGSSGDSPPRGHFRSGARAADFYPPAFGSGRGNGAFDMGADLALARDPLVIAVHLGTNDLHTAPPFWPYSFDHGATLAASRAAELAELLLYIGAQRPGPPPRIVLSLIIPASGRGQDVVDWNEEAIAMAEDLAEGAGGGRPLRIALADHHARFATNPDLFAGGPGDWMHDGLHPNRAGYAEMAAVYAAAIAAAATDSLPPAPITDLAPAAIGLDRVTLAFHAPGDDGATGRAARYDLRVATRPLTRATFAHAQAVRGEPAPATAGAADSFVVHGLAPGRQYFFAAKATDDGGNRAPISNVIAVTTAARGRTVVSLQNGVRGYAGTADSSLVCAGANPRLRADPRGTLSIGATPRPGGPPDVHRARLRFDLAAIPATAHVHAARLRLFCYASGAAEPGRIAAHRGADPGADPLAVAEMAGAGDWVEWDVTAAVQAWVRGTWENDGLVLAAADETAASRSWFWSTAYADDAHLRPLLRVDYALGAAVARPGGDGDER